MTSRRGRKPLINGRERRGLKSRPQSVWNGRSFRKYLAHLEHRIKYEASPAPGAQFEEGRPFVLRGERGAFNMVVFLRVSLTIHEKTFHEPAMDFLCANVREIEPLPLCCFSAKLYPKDK